LHRMHVRKSRKQKLLGKPKNLNFYLEVSAL
jgi:hypothetical protein